MDRDTRMRLMIADLMLQGSELADALAASRQREAALEARIVDLEAQVAPAEDGRVTPAPVEAVR